MVEKHFIAHIEQSGALTDVQAVYQGDFYTIDSFIREHDNTNIYSTVNPFKPQSEARTKENVARIIELRLDLDLRLRATEKDVKQGVVDFLVMKAQANDIPRFNKLISSGRGLYIVYQIDNETNILAFNSLAKGLLASIDKQLAKYDPLLAVDKNRRKLDKQAIGAERLFRIEGSINSKNNEVVQTLYTGPTTAYKFTELFTELGYSQKRITAIMNKSTGSYHEKERIRPKLPKHFTEMSLYNARLDDLEDLQDTRKERGYHTGYRNLLLFYYGVALRIQEQDIGRVEQAMNAFNSNYKYPLTQAEVNATIRGTVKRKYYLKNKTMITELGITLAEQRALKTIISHTVYRERARLRDNKRYESTKEQNTLARELRNALIVEMKQDNPNMTQQEIADLMGVNKSTVSRVLKKANS